MILAFILYVSPRFLILLIIILIGSVINQTQIIRLKPEGWPRLSTLTTKSFKVSGVLAEWLHQTSVIALNGTKQSTLQHHLHWRAWSGSNPLWCLHSDAFLSLYHKSTCNSYEECASPDKKDFTQYTVWWQESLGLKSKSNNYKLFPCL